MSFWNGNEKSPIFVGPWGGEGGSPWDDGVYATTRQVEVVHGAAIDSIRIEYHKKGSSVWSEKHGGNGGTKTDKIDLGNNHYLTAISGYYGNYFGYIVIRSLTFVSTMGTHGPYGPKEGTAFSLPVKAGKVVGFFGRAGQWLDALGFYLKPTLA